MLGIDTAQLAWSSNRPEESVCHTARDFLDPAIAAARASGSLFVDAVAGSDLARHWVQRPPDNLRSLDELRQVAAARCAHLHGGEPGDWLVTADWHAGRPFVCAALPSAIAEALESGMARAGLRIQWMTAWSQLCAVHAGTLPDDGWAAVRSPARIVLWRCRKGHVDRLVCLSMPATAAHSDANARVAQHLRLEAARGDGAADETVSWIDVGPAAATAPGARRSRVLKPDSPAVSLFPDSEALMALQVGRLAAQSA